MRDRGSDSSAPGDIRSFLITQSHSPLNQPLFKNIYMHTFLKLNSLFGKLTFLLLWIFHKCCGLCDPLPLTLVFWTEYQLVFRETRVLDTVLSKILSTLETLKHLGLDPCYLFMEHEGDHKIQS